MKYPLLLVGISLASALVYGCSPKGTALVAALPPLAAAPKPGEVLTGKAAFADWTTERPGVRRHITVADLPEPFATESPFNMPRVVSRPDGAWPQVPEGFVVTEFATGLSNPRQIITAPNGDLFIAESQPGRIHILRGMKDGHPAVSEIYAAGLRQPFGLAFYPNGANPKYLYVGNTDAVVR